VRKTLHAAMAQAERWEHVSSNPVSLTRAPRQQHAERKTLSPQQALAFLDHVRGDRLEALWNIATCLGLRSSEVRGLTWESINGNVLHVHEALGMQPGEWTLHEPKTQNGRRSMELPDYIVEQLKERREAQHREERTIGYSNPMGLTFTTPDGYPLSSQWLRMRLHTLLTEAGLPIIAFHDLRHAAVSLMLARGIPVRLVQQVIGHKTVQNTHGGNAHPDAEQRGQARQNLEDWRNGL
jgi:integrase